MIRIVADTNVYISAIVFGGTCEAILALARAGVVDPVISPPILRDTFAWPDAQVREAMAEIAGLSSLVRPAIWLSGIVSHDSDHRLLECAVAAQAAFLVTGNTKHFESLKSFQGVQIVTPRQFLDLLRPADSG